MLVLLADMTNSGRLLRAFTTLLVKLYCHKLYRIYFCATTYCVIVQVSLAHYS